MNNKPAFFRLHSGRLNWPLAIGSVIVALLAALVAAGPGLAPRDPMAMHAEVIIVGGRFLFPPFPPFTLPEYPLGSDRVGRDVLSRLLAGVRPTMILVSAVALARLSVGSAIGLLSGWSERWFGRALDVIISAVLSVPILIAAIAIIAALGSAYGVMAFVLGLSVTGWAETARAVREQTRVIKGQYYIEAARALGASNAHVLSRHVLPQITPLLSILFALEISRTLMVTGGLGFLGYYIGGGVWFTVEDFVERNIVGLPELGQMLSTFGLLEPWGMFAAGSVVFLAVLGFNLLGDGLRRRFIVEGS